MKFVKKYFGLILFILPAFLNAQNLLSIQSDYADNLFKTKQYFDAITEYKRLLFFDSKKEYAYDVNLKIGKAYKAGAKLDEAINYFAIAEMNASAQAQKSNAKIEIIKTNILRRTTDRALQLLNELENDKSSAIEKDSLNYWRGWAYIFADDWKKAGEYFAKINSYNELKLLCNKVENEKVSVTFAKVISYILPGAGQIYAGHFGSGLLSLGYNVLFGYLAINSFASDRIFDGAAVGLLLWLRFYRGNIQNAESFAIEKNIETSNNALRYLQNNYQGSKP